MSFPYDYSHRVDERELAEIRSEQTYVQAVGWVADRIAHALQRYERKLGRTLNSEEGQVLMHALTTEAPQNTSRFFKCNKCGMWNDRGPMDRRTTSTFCDDCDGIPF